MSSEKKKLLNGFRRMRGQLEAMQRALEDDSSYIAILQQATTCRGALNGFIAEVIEDHIRENIADPAQSGAPYSAATEELVEIVHSCLT